MITLEKTLAAKPVALKTRLSRLFSFYAVVQVLAIYAVLSPILGMQIYNRLLFIPSPGHNTDSIKDVFTKIESATHSKFSKRTIISGTNAKLDAWYFEKKDVPKLFIISHGNGGSIANRIPLIPDLLFAGGSVLMYDYQGYGFSTGEPSVAALKQDGLAAYDYARNVLHYEPKDIILYGESLGSGVTTYIAENRPVAGIVIQSGFSSLSRAAQDRLLWLRVYPKIAFKDVEFDNEAYLRGKHAPLLWVHGEIDQTLPITHAEETIAAATEPKKLVVFKGAGHNDIPLLNPKLFATTIGDFVRTLP
ncbi:MAG TPA: alpha/beta hydrolase [Drouetiella sp.]